MELSPFAGDARPSCGSVIAFPSGGCDTDHLTADVETCQSGSTLSNDRRAPSPVFLNAHQVILQLFIQAPLSRHLILQSLNRVFALCVQSRQLFPADTKLCQLVKQPAVLRHEEVLQRPGLRLVGDLGVRVRKVYVVIGIKVCAREFHELRSAGLPHKYEMLVTYLHDLELSLDLVVVAELLHARLETINLGSKGRDLFGRILGLL